MESGRARSCIWPPAFSDVAAYFVSVRVCAFVCVSGRLTSLSFLLILILTKKKKKKQEENILGLGRRAGRPTDVIQEKSKCAIKERERDCKGAFSKEVFDKTFLGPANAVL